MSKQEHPKETPVATETQQEKKPENFAVGTGQPPADPVKAKAMKAVEDKETVKAGEAGTGRQRAAAIAPEPGKPLTREGIERILAEGGSVIWHPPGGGPSRFIDHISRIPSEVDIVGDDPEKRAALKKQLQERRDLIDQEIDRL